MNNLTITQLYNIDNKINAKILSIFDIHDLSKLENQKLIDELDETLCNSLKLKLWLSLSFYGLEKELEKDIQINSSFSSIYSKIREQLL